MFPAIRWSGDLEEVVLKLNIQDIQFEQKDNHPDANLDVAFVQIWQGRKDP